MTPRELFYRIFLDEYFFTFLATALSVIFKGLTSRETYFFKKRNTYDLGVEMVFIAVSFVLSHLSQVIGSFTTLIQERDMAQQKFKLLAADGLSWSEAAKALTEQLKTLETKIATLELAQTGLYIILASLIVYLFMLVLYMRRYALESDGQVNLVRGILIPDILGILAVILALSFSVKV